MNTTTTIQFNEEVCALTYSACPEGYSSKQRHTILYISNPFDPEELNWNGITEQPDHSVKGDDPENDKLWRKYNKAELQIQKKIISKAVQDGLLDPKIADKLKWSRFAGCSCPCSPGWKAKDWGRRSIRLTVTSPSKEEEKKQRQQEYESKREAETLASVVI